MGVIIVKFGILILMKEHFKVGLALATFLSILHSPVHAQEEKVIPTWERPLITSYFDGDVWVYEVENSHTIFIRVARNCLDEGHIALGLRSELENGDSLSLIATRISIDIHGTTRPVSEAARLEVSENTPHSLVNLSNDYYELALQEKNKYKVITQIGNVCAPPVEADTA